MGRKKSPKPSQPSPAPSSSPEVPSPAGTRGSESVSAEPSRGASSSSSALLQLADAAADEESAAPPPVPVSSPSSALFLCQRAEEAARDGNLRKARRLIEVCLSHPEKSQHLGQIYRVHAEIYALFANIVADSDEKGRYSAVAKESALKAVEIRPRSVDYSHFRAKLLYRQAIEPDDYAAVIAECQRGVSIQIPEEQSTSTSANCRRELIRLMWYSLLAMVRDPDSVPSSVAASEAEAEAERGSLAAKKCGERSESAGKKKSLAAKKCRESYSIDMEKNVLEYWNSLIYEDRKEWLRIEVSRVAEHVKSLSINWLGRSLKDAMACWMSNGSWQSFSCLYDECKVSRNPEPLKRHILREHVPSFTSMNELRIDDERADAIVKSSWMPLDGEATRKVLEDGVGREGGTGPRCLSPNRWIVSADSECRRHLEEIHSLLLELIRRGCLAKSHVDMVTGLALKLRTMPDNVLAGCGLKLFPACVWCLGATQLTQILPSLRHINNSCREDSNVENIDRSIDMLKTMEMEDQIILNDEASYFILQEGLLLDFSCKNVWEDWILTVNQKRREAADITEMLQKEGSVLQLLCGRRSELLNKKTAPSMQRTWEICTGDALILQVVARIERLAREFIAVQAIDYHALLVPLIGSLVRGKLEGAAHVYAAKKSNAAAEELMKEDMLVPGKGQRGNNNIRPLQKKNRKKNKKKRTRNAAGDVEATGSGEGDVIHDETNQPDSSSLAQPPNSDTYVSSDNNEIEEEGETRFMPEELGDIPGIPVVEQQKGVEDADKRKLLIGRQEKQMHPSPGSMQALTSTNTRTPADAQDAYQQSMDRTFEQIDSKNNLVDNIRGTSGDAGFASAVPVDSSSEPAHKQSNHTDVKQGDARWVSNPKLGRKGKWQTDSMEKLELHWNSLTTDEKKQLLTVKVSDLEDFFGSSKVDSIHEFITESLEFTRTHGTWTLFVCCKCQEKFGDLNSHKQHVLTEHLNNQSREVQAGLSESIVDALDEMINSHSWKPLDISTVLNMLESQDVGGNSPVPYSSTSNWSTSEDSQRIELLKKIQQRFEELIRRKFLAASHLNRVLQFIRDDLQGIASGTLFQKYGLDRMPICICFLGAIQLGKILKFLDVIFDRCGLVLGSKGSYTSLEEASSITEGVEDEKNVIVPSEGASCSLQHEKFPPSECTTSASLETFLNVCFEEDTSNAAILSWIFTESSTREALRSWKHSTKEKISQGEEVLKMLQEQYDDLRHLCDRRLELLNSEEALNALDGLVHEEGGGKIQRPQMCKSEQHVWLEGAIE